MSEDINKKLDLILSNQAAIVKRLNKIGKMLAEHMGTPADGWKRTAEGLPICPKHKAVMRERQARGNTWFAHGVLDGNGDPIKRSDNKSLYCHGYEGGPGWDS